VASPLIIGHEFSATVEAIGASALDVGHEPLRPGTRVAVDPAQPCGCCESCAHGHPNLCLRLHFCGTYRDGGSLCEWMHMPAQTIAGIKALSPRPDSVPDTPNVPRHTRN
jgi:threonine dehydrogenase-like Zn-dependent dehydrogenase